MPVINIFLVDDHPSMVWGLERLILSNGPAMQVVGKAGNCAEALALLDTVKPDVLLLDMDLGSESGLDAIPRLTAKTSAKILVLTGMRDQAMLDQAILAGAMGIVQKDAKVEIILNAIARVYEGQLWLDRNSTGRLFMEFSRRTSRVTRDPEQVKIASLTMREREIVSLAVVYAGSSAKVIAEKLHISEHTLRNQLTSIYKKLDVKNRLELLAYAQKHEIRYE